MDALSDLLRVVRLDAAYFYPVKAAEPWSFLSRGAQELAPRILPGAEYLIAYHVLRKGRCFAGIAGQPQIEMLPGDVIIFPHGQATVMSSARDLHHWRMQVAANLLVERTDKVAWIADEVGYDSEAAFSRASKKATGLAPGAWRARRQCRRIEAVMPAA